MLDMKVDWCLHLAIATMLQEEMRKGRHFEYQIGLASLGIKLTHLQFLILNHRSSGHFVSYGGDNNNSWLTRISSGLF